mmetsp:Transcript_13507/g.39423  ORF Transcript_13507/g.39423 Transcript_13507/m.39423 type:complete len:241 (+) Transcript_13507:83-805(+)|eukprot:CAMPEP_0168385780 /NCGR_PEP_ID=MMETSP0228-20121227/15093_1 /TAXON_ID=133427 /ORGANISM="Protoceratium reticulatum, Strain CCCM 535 (=CCMP 1889)" /LENGTH=240 /DNA_ID=CAMNT_0008398969 /DNA_START=81 /DNA_END=803 /DNA_ORIENTATION=+
MASMAALRPADLKEPLTAKKASDTPDTTPAARQPAGIEKPRASLAGLLMVVSFLALGCLALSFGGKSPSWFSLRGTPTPSANPSQKGASSSPLDLRADDDIVPMTTASDLLAGDGNPRSKKMASVFAAFGNVELPGGDFKQYLASDFAWQINVVETGKTVNFASRDAAFDALNRVLGSITMPDQNYAQKTIRIDEESKVVVLAWQAKDFGSSMDINFFNDDYKLRFLETNMASCPLELCK